jgi:hypothetical protein
MHTVVNLVEKDPEGEAGVFAKMRDGEGKADVEANDRLGGVTKPISKQSSRKRNLEALVTVEMAYRYCLAGKKN